MFDLLFSFHFVWIAIVIMVLSSAVAFFCILLHQRLLYIPVAEWLAEHVYCPISRVLLLMLMAFLLFPLMIENTSYSQLSQLFFQADFLINMLNILFFSSLIFSFLPVFNHPAFGMPVLGCIAIALFYLHHSVIPAHNEFNWFPSGNALGKIVLLMILTHMLSRWLNNTVSEWVDLRFLVTDSKNLLVDINYLIFQIPVILAYGHSLQLQNSVS